MCAICEEIIIFNDQYNETAVFGQYRVNKCKEIKRHKDSNYTPENKNVQSLQANVPLYYETAMRDLFKMNLTIYEYRDLVN